jgi:PAS domain S-box-containing protein
MWVFDHETLAFLEVNDSAIRNYGYSREEFQQMTLRHIRVSDETPALMEYLHQLVPQGQAPQKLAGVWRHRKKDGTTMDVEIKWAPLSFRGRSASLTMANDVTERLRMEQQTAALSNLGKRLSSATSAGEAAKIICSVAEELFVWDAFILNLYSQENDQIRTLLSIDTNLEGERFEIKAGPDARPPSPMSRRIIEHGAELILREEPVQMPPDATPIGDLTRPSASLMLVPIRNRTRVIGVLSIQSYTPKAYSEQDLGILQTLADHCGGALERIHAEQALQQSELLFHSVWTNSLDGMRLVNEAGVIVAANEAFCRMVGMPQGEVLGAAFTKVLAASENPEHLLRCYQSRFRRRQVLPPQDKPVTLHNGQTVHLEDRSSFVELPGQPPMVLTVLRDVTTQKRLEDQLRHAQKMEAIGQLAGGVAHDFNNILTVIHGHASLMLSGGDCSERSTRSAEQILQAAERAAGLTRQLLTFSRRQVLQTRRVDLNEVVGNMTKMLGRILGEDITLQLNYAPQPAGVNADPGMIEQVLLNLVVNSRDAMPQGGVLNVRIGFCVISEQEAAAEPEGMAGSFVCLSVSDNGCGIPRENLRRIFEPFFTTKQVGKGTGLGLATVYGIVRQHQGWTQVQSEVARGTTFRVLLPRLSTVDAPSEPAPEPPPIRGGHETILVVEDEGSVRELVCHLLTNYGYNILQAESGVKALELWQEAKDKVDLLLTDLVMPDRMNGRELAERLWTDRPALPVIFTSGYSADVVGRDFVTRSGLQYLQKPYHPQKLALVVRDCLDAESGN